MRSMVQSFFGFFFGTLRSQAEQIEQMQSTVNEYWDFQTKVIGLVQQLVGAGDLHKTASAACYYTREGDMMNMKIRQHDPSLYLCRAMSQDEIYNLYAAMGEDSCISRFIKGMQELGAECTHYFNDSYQRQLHFQYLQGKELAKLAVVLDR